MVKRGRPPPWAMGSKPSKAQLKALRGAEMQAAAIAERLDIADCEISQWAKTNRKNNRRKRTKVITADDGGFSVTAEGSGDGEDSDRAATESEVHEARDPVEEHMSDDEGDSSSGDDYVCCGKWCAEQYEYPVQLVQDLRRYYYNLPEADRQEFIDQRVYLPEGRRTRTQRCMEPPAVLRGRLNALRTQSGAAGNGPYGHAAGRYSSHILSGK